MERCLVLVVEDNPIVRRVAQLYLRKYSIDVHTAIDGIEAVEAAALNDYDLILMDVQMPRMNGLQAQGKYARQSLATDTCRSWPSQRALRDSNAWKPGWTAILKSRLTMNELFANGYRRKLQPA